MKILNVRYLIHSGQKTAKAARLIAKSIDLAIALAMSLLFYPIGLIVAVAYLLLADAMPSGQSIGKKIVGLGVVSLLDGEFCSVKQSCIRNLALGLPLAIGIIPIIGWFIGAILLAALCGMEVYFILKLDSGMRLGDVMSDTSVNGNDPNREDLKKRQPSWFDHQKPMTMQ